MKSSSLRACAVVTLLTTIVTARVVVACSSDNGSPAAPKPDGSTPIDDGSATPPNDGGSTETAASACTAVATARCTRLDACTNGVGTKLRYGDSATCIRRLSEQCLAALGAPSTSATPATTKACADSLGTEDCAMFLGVDTSDECLPKPGALPDNAPCATSAQCQSAFCNAGPNVGCGVCAPATKPGDPCSATVGCGRGFVCDKASGSCVAPLVAEAPCNGTIACGSLLHCKSIDDAGLDDGGKIKDGVCEPEATSVGASCKAGDGTCSRASGLYCDRSGKTCAVLGLANPAETCGDLDGGTMSACTGGDCSIPDGQKSGTCAALIGDNAPCDPTGNGPGCLPPAKCVGTAGAATCKRLDPSACK